MTVKIRRKVSRQRGSTTHGWGSRKKHRGFGSRGGKGMAGTGKRADSKKPSIWKNRLYGGRRFFTPPRQIILKTVNVSYLDENADKLGLKQENGVYIVNLKELGFGKLLGSGRVNKKFKITAQHASKKAVDAVKKAGGEIIVKEKELVNKLVGKKSGKEIKVDK